MPLGGVRIGKQANIEELGAFGTNRLTETQACIAGLMSSRESGGLDKEREEAKESGGDRGDE
jgi:hypothetical protein